MHANMPTHIHTRTWFIKVCYISFFIIILYMYELCEVCAHSHSHTHLSVPEGIMLCYHLYHYQKQKIQL